MRLGSGQKYVRPFAEWVCLGMFQVESYQSGVLYVLTSISCGIRSLVGSKRLSQPRDISPTTRYVQSQLSWPD